MTTTDVLKRVRSIRPTSEVKHVEVEETHEPSHVHITIDALKN